MDYYLNKKNNFSDKALFDYSASNSNSIVSFKDTPLSQHTKWKDDISRRCHGFTQHLQYFNTMPYVKSINNVPKQFLYLEEDLT